MRELGERGDSDFLRTTPLYRRLRRSRPDRGFNRPEKNRHTRPEPRRCPTRPKGMPITSATRSRLGEHLTGRLNCWRSVAVPVVQTALAAGLSWFVAVHLFGHRAPLFARCGHRLHRYDARPGAASRDRADPRGQRRSRRRRAADLRDRHWAMTDRSRRGPGHVGRGVTRRPGGDQRSGSGVCNPGGDVVRAG